MRIFRLSSSLALPDVGYHGTTVERAMAIMSDGLLRPRQAEGGNWSGGMFGGNPSNPDMVYVCLDPADAASYAREVGRIGGTGDVAVVSVLLDWNRAFLDEDVVFEALQSDGGPAADKLWAIYARQNGMTVDEAKVDWKNDSPDVEPMSDSELASRMKSVALEANDVLSPDELAAMMGVVAAFRGPLRATGMEIVRTGEGGRRKGERRQPPNDQP